MRAALMLGAGLTVAASAFAAPPAVDAGAVAAGGNLFTISCSSSYCHGSGGVGARGPSLQNRDFPLDYVRTTILQGRPGTPMPSFKGTFRPDEIAALVAFVQSLSPGGAAASEEAAPIAAAGPLSQQATLGSDIFFDASRHGYCAGCHSFRGEGGPVGPDLALVSSESAADIFHSIAASLPDEKRFPAIKVTLRGGTTYTGVKRDERPDTVRLYDLSSVPPVLRSFAKVDIAKLEPLAGKPAYRHDLSAYTDADLAALVDYLKSGAANAPAEIKPGELGPRR